VAAALKALRSSPSLVFSTQNGWAIAVDEKARTIWSFAPSSSAAYPAVVKREIVQRGPMASVKTSVLCEAAKQPCDDLVRVFAEMLESQRP
jgi:hypothetical protein